MWMLFPLALAQDAPLALPARPDSSFVPAAKPSKAATAPRLAEYQNRAVSVRRYATLQGGGATALGWGWGWPGFGSPYGGFSTSYIIGNPVYEVEHWAVYRGSQRLTVPQWMDVADVPEAREELRKRVRRTKAWHSVSIGTAIVGGIAMVASTWASQSARNYDEYENWQLAQAAGTTALAGGIIGAFGTGVHARTLRYDFDRTQDLGQTQGWVREHNQRLREELGLTADQTSAIDGRE